MRASGKSPVIVQNAEARAGKLMNAARAANAQSGIGSVATDWLTSLGTAGAAKIGRARKTTGATLRSMNLTCVNEELVESLIVAHHRSAEGGGGGGDGSVLVFLPGAYEIDSLRERLERASERKCGGGGLKVVPLHSQLSTAEQRDAFPPPPRGTTKVVLATDIAETSVTIPDVTLVIDGGLHRRVSCDEITGAPHLRTARISLSAASQRAGRAGRVRAGRCFHLFCKAESESRMAMPIAPSPEILCVPLEGLCLRVRSILRSDARRLRDILAESLTPPDPAAVARAVASLTGLGLLTPGRTEVLTPRGQRVSRIPTDPRLGVALVCAAGLGCLTPVAVVAAALSAPSEMFGRSAAAGDAKRALDKSSDHMALIRAFEEFESRRGGGGGGGGGRGRGGGGGGGGGGTGTSSQVAEELGVSAKAMREIKRAVSQLVSDTARACGFRVGGGGIGSTSAADYDTNATEMALVKASLVMGLSARAMRVVAKAPRRGTLPSAPKEWQLRWRTQGGSGNGKKVTERVLSPHNATVLGSAGRGGGGGKGNAGGDGGGAGGGANKAVKEGDFIIAFGILSMSSGVRALDLSVVTPLALLVFGGGCGPLPVVQPTAEEIAAAEAAAAAAAAAAAQGKSKGKGKGKGNKGKTKGGAGASSEGKGNDGVAGSSVVVHPSVHVHHEGFAVRNRKRRVGLFIGLIGLYSRFMGWVISLRQQCMCECVLSHKKHM